MGQWHPAKVLWKGLRTLTSVAWDTSSSKGNGRKDSVKCTRFELKGVSWMDQCVLEGQMSNQEVYSAEVNSPSI